MISPSSTTSTTSAACASSASSSSLKTPLRLCSAFWIRVACKNSVDFVTGLFVSNLVGIEQGVSSVGL